MSVTTRNPLRLAGAIVNSGFPATGEVPFTRGGMRNGVFWSGNLLTNSALTGLPAGSVTSGGHVQVWSGPGRLHTIIPHQFMTSGQPIWFYDAGAISVSGVSVSGQRIIGIVPLTMPAALAALSGNIALNLHWQREIVVDMPFTSGLCYAAASGSPGASFAFTPETNPAVG